MTLSGIDSIIGELVQPLEVDVPEFYDAAFWHAVVSLKESAPEPDGLTAGGASDDRGDARGDQSQVCSLFGGSTLTMT